MLNICPNNAIMLLNRNKNLVQDENVGGGYHERIYY